MPGSDEVERKIREMLVEMGDCRLLAEFEGAIKASNEQNRRIDETLEELLQEVDELLLQMDELDAASLEPEEYEESEEEICIR
jgi:DNA repair ATPase RecN